MSTTEIEPVLDKVPEVKHMKMSRLDDSLFSKELAPHYMKLAGQLASSELVPKCFRNKPQDLFICWAMGYQIGLTPEQAMQCIAVINGKPAMWGDDMLALCMSHREFEDIIEEPMLKDGVVIGYMCTVKRKGKTDKSNPFTLDDAKKAGLLAKGGVWAQYPGRMLKLRARGFTLRDAFPDALKGIKPREEVEDYIIDADYTVTEHKGSRTERLKQDIITKQGVSNGELVKRSVADDEHQSPIKATIEDEEHREETENSGKSSDLHLTIKGLIAEKQFTEARLKKALTYYEVENIEELSVEASNNFIEKLIKL